MAREIINVGTGNNTKDGEPLRSAGIKLNNMTAELYNGFTGWESRSDIVNTVSLTLSTDNIVQITGASESNGGLTFLNTNAKINAISLNDVIQIDFACTFVTPSGVDHYIDIKIKVGSFFYRGYTYNLTKGAGINDLFSVSWSLPCGADVVANGIEIVLNPSATMNYKQRYIAVNRTHKGI